MQFVTQAWHFGIGTNDVLFVYFWPGMRQIAINQQSSAGITGRESSQNSQRLCIVRNFVQHVCLNHLTYFATAVFFALFPDGCSATGCTAQNVDSVKGEQRGTYSSHRLSTVRRVCTLCLEVIAPVRFAHLFSVHCLQIAALHALAAQARDN